MSTATWTDATGRTWSTAIKVNELRRARELAGVDLADAFDGKVFGKLADDPVLLVNTLYAVCKPQADERKLTEEQFGELLVGDTIEHAAAALVRGLIDFFPKGKQAVLERLWTASQRARTDGLQLANEKMDSQLFEDAMQGMRRKASAKIDRRLRKLGGLSGNSPASSASTPAS